MGNFLKDFTKPETYQALLAELVGYWSPHPGGAAGRKHLMRSR